MKPKKIKCYTMLICFVMVTLIASCDKNERNSDNINRDERNSKNIIGRWTCISSTCRGVNDNQRGQTVTFREDGSYIASSFNLIAGDIGDEGFWSIIDDSLYIQGCEHKCVCYIQQLSNTKLEYKVDKGNVYYREFQK